MESQSAVLLGPKSSTHEIITFYWILVFYGQAAVNCTYSFSASLPAFRETHVATVSATLAVSLTTHAPSTATCSQLLPPVTWRVLQGVFTGGAAIIIVSVTLAVRLALGSRRASLKRLSQGFGGLKCHTFAALKKMTVFFPNWKKQIQIHLDGVSIMWIMCMLFFLTWCGKGNVHAQRFFSNIPEIPWWSTITISQYIILKYVMACKSR